MFRQPTQSTNRNSLVCPTPGCSYRKPFNKKSDLNRHLRSVHLATYEECPYEDCSKAFKRKDKLKKHLRECHPQVRCLLHHCSADIADIYQEHHQDTEHGDVECALGLCKDSPPSRFTQPALKRHLRKHHGLGPLGWWGEFLLWDRVTRSVGKAFTNEHFMWLQSKERKWRPTWEECSVCLARQQPTAAGGIDAGSHDGHPEGSSA
ncbi:hypothetical protein QBC47DRAFT_46740 [Echria macrotheca]|uniref:C2H2-type domain-containing protein n=1 Tax=Echria macrotheca TaxID=438768 RepID=A0AAJ0BD56_9PEZI|nr:hypothetical protein QBC47DRAFT_46740 [Echria macrotheca]